jgi:hypothetical protein
VLFFAFANDFASFVVPIGLLWHEKIQSIYKGWELEAENLVVRENCGDLELKGEFGVEEEQPSVGDVSKWQKLFSHIFGKKKHSSAIWDLIMTAIY